jgi:5-methylcytosine-specific restriction endonuclease McrA
LSDCPALVLNADYTPLSYYPLSLWPWQTAIKAIFLERVDIVASYERVVHSPSWSMQVPSVIALRQFVKPSEFPAFTRFNVFLRDRFACQYCGSPHHLTFDHVVPLQHAQGRPHPAAGAHAAAYQADPADQLAAPGTRPGLSAQLPARDLARLALLGRRARSVIGRVTARKLRYETPGRTARGRP